MRRCAIHFPVATAVAVALTFGATGCGGNDAATTTTAKKSSTTTTAKPPLSKEFTISNLLTRDAQFAEFRKVLATAQADKELAGKGPVTLLAPNHAAFDALGAATVAQLTSNQAAAKKFVNRQIVKGKVTFADLLGKNGKTVTTVDGTILKVVVNGTNVTIAGAPVVKNDIAAHNGMIHVISRAIPTS